MDEGTYIITQGLWCRHLFYHFSDIFFTIMSLFQGGIFRGWFAKKKPTTDARKGDTTSISK